MDLKEKIFNMSPTWFRILFFELEEDEKRFIETASENESKISRYIYDSIYNREKTIKTYGDMREKIIECEQDRASMKFLLKRYGNGRFHKYFSEKIDSFDKDIKFLLGYRH